MAQLFRASALGLCRAERQMFELRYMPVTFFSTICPVLYEFTLLFCLLVPGNDRNKTKSLATLVNKIKQTIES